MNNLLPESLTPKATCSARDYPNTRDGTPDQPSRHTLAVFDDLGAKLFQKNYYVELGSNHKKRPSERLMYVLDHEIPENNGKNEEMIAIIKIMDLIKCPNEAQLGDGIAFLLNGGPHDGENGNNTHIVFTYKGSPKEVFQKEGPNKEFNGPKGGKFNAGEDDIPELNFDLGNLKELGYVGYKVQSIKKANGSREYVASVDRRIDQQTKQFSGEWDEWLRVLDEGNFKDNDSDPGIPVNNRTWHNWIRMDSAKAEIVFFNVTHS